MMSCFCSSGKPKKKKSLYDEYIVEDRILSSERELLGMVFENLASRSPDRKLTSHNFMLFFSLTGLWGEKLFKYYCGANKNSISLGQFLTGIARTIRAEHSEKIKLLFNLVKEPTHTGIRYRQFLKMLYHFSKEELKQILVNDGVFVHESIIPQNTKQKCQNASTVHFRHQPLPNMVMQKKTSFEKAYQDIINQYDECGTTLNFKTETFTYKVDYINMITLTKEFAHHVFRKFDIDENFGFMDENQFKQWVSNNPKFYEGFYSSFRQNIWSYKNKSPLFLKYIQKQSEICLLQGGMKQKLYMMLAENILFFSIAKDKKDRIFRIICMDGLSITVCGQNNVEFKDLPNGLSKFILQFSNSSQMSQWLSVLSNFEKNYVQTKYEIKDPIGTGKFSVVYKAIQKKTLKPYALKVINLQKLNERGKESIENQTNIMKILKSPSILKHYETVYSKQNIYISTQYIYGEDLFEYVKRNKRLNEYQAAFILGQIIQAVMHLHSLEIIHRDLKPENIMIQFKRQIQSEQDEALSPNRILTPQAETVKIIDLGFSNYHSAYENLETPSIEGTPNYIAPQVLLGQKPQYENDAFAIGSILYFMLRGKLAFASQQPDGTIIRTVRGDYSLNDSIWNKISDEAKDLVQSLLQIEPQERISLADALNHPWFTHIDTPKNSRKDSTDHE